MYYKRDMIKVPGGNVSVCPICTGVFGGEFGGEKGHRVLTDLKIGGSISIRCGESSVNRAYGVYT